MTTQSRSHSPSIAWFVSACLGIAGWAACGGPAPQPETPKAPEPVVSSPAPAASTPAPIASTPAPQPEPVTSASAAPSPAPLPGFTTIPADVKGKYPGGNVAKARMFDLSGECAEPIGAEGRPCAAATQPGAEMTKVQIERTILLLTDQRAFSHGAPKCFTPDHAVVFYDDKDLPIAWVSLSLSCSSMKGRPALQGIAVPQDGTYNIAGAAIGFLKGTCNTLKLKDCGKK